MPQVIGVIQGRMGSTRLPGKLLAPLNGLPLLKVLVERIRAANVDEWWLATTRDAQDDVSEAWGEALGLHVLRGDPEDVLSRFATIAADRRPDWVVRVTADDPFVDAGIVDLLVAAALRGDVADHIGAAPESGLPLGYVPEAVRAAALLELASSDLAPHDRAHVTSALTAAGRTTGPDVPAQWPRRPDWRWTIDTATDLSMADAAFRALGPDWPRCDYPAIVAILDRHPEIVGRNAAVRQKPVADG
jgi:spore coat polysaccharide biosynthesis protein SpsF